MGDAGVANRLLNEVLDVNLHPLQLSLVKVYDTKLLQRWFVAIETLAPGGLEPVPPADRAFMVL